MDPERGGEFAERRSIAADEPREQLFVGQEVGHPQGSGFVYAAAGNVGCPIGLDRD